MRSRPTSFARATGPRAKRRSSPRNRTARIHTRTGHGSSSTHVRRTSLRSHFGLKHEGNAIMNLDQLLESIPNYAKDLRLNFSALVRNQTELTPQQLWGTLVASAIASRNRELIQATVA